MVFRYVAEFFLRWKKRLPTILRGAPCATMHARNVPSYVSLAISSTDCASLVVPSLRVSSAVAVAVAADLNLSGPTSARTARHLYLSTLHGVYPSAWIAHRSSLEPRFVLPVEGSSRESTPGSSMGGREVWQANCAKSASTERLTAPSEQVNFCRR